MIFVLIIAMIFKQCIFINFFLFQGLTVKVDAVERRLAAIENGPQDPQLTGSIINSNDGSAVWKIPDFSQARRAAVNETRVSLMIDFI